MSKQRRLDAGAILRLIDGMTDFGFCLSREDTNKLVTDPPDDVESFVEAIFAGEGLDAKFRGPLYRDIKARVTELFAKYG